MPQSRRTRQRVSPLDRVHDCLQVKINLWFFCSASVLYLIYNLVLLALESPIDAGPWGGGKLIGLGVVLWAPFVILLTLLETFHSFVEERVYQDWIRTFDSGCGQAERRWWEGILSWVIKLHDTVCSKEYHADWQRDRVSPEGISQRFYRHVDPGHQ